MAKKKSEIIAALTSISKARHDMDELWQTIHQFDRDDLGQESHDRSCALVLTAILEQGLESAILSHCISLGETDKTWLFGGPEGEGAFTFASKIRLGLALGIYGQNTRHDLGMFRHIRNTFAHSKRTLSFSDPEIGAACDSLKFLEKAKSTDWLEGRKADHKSNFIEAIRCYYNYLEHNPTNEPIRYQGHEVEWLYD